MVVMSGVKVFSAGIILICCGQGGEKGPVMGVEAGC